MGPEAPALAPLQCDAAGDSGCATSTTPGSSRGGALASPTKKSRKKMKIRGPRNFNLKSREVVSDTDSDEEDSSAALAEEEDVDVATAAAAGDATAIKRGAAVVGRSNSSSSSSLLLVEKRRKTTTADAAPASADQRAEDKRVVVTVERRRSNNTNSLLLGLAGVEKDDGEEDEVRMATKLKLVNKMLVCFFNQCFGS